MKIKFFKYLILMLSGWALLSCEEDKMPYLQLKDKNVSFDLNTSRFNPSVVETEAKLKVPVVLAGIPGTFPVTVSVGTDTTGHKNPAVEGVDYTIREKTITFEEGYGTRYIEVLPVNNEERQPDRSFDLVITSTTPALVPNPANRITITIVDGGHPLLYMKGDYKVTAHDRAWTGEIVNFYVQIIPDPEDDNAVYVANFPLGLIPQNINFRMIVDAENKECRVPGQDVGSFDAGDGDMKGTIAVYYTYTFINPEDGEEYADYDEDIDITFKYLNGGKRLEANSMIGAFVTSGNYKGNFFFLFDDLVMEKQSIAAQALVPQNIPGYFPDSSIRIPFRRK